MAERHVDALFAEAVDGRLGASEQARFDAHVSSCDRCAEAFADHGAVRDALRGLPVVRMPVPVRLPAHAPRAAGGALLRVPRSWRGRRLLLPLGGMAAVAAAAVVVLALSHSGGSTPVNTAALPPQQAGASAAAALAAPASPAGDAADMPPPAVPVPAGIGFAAPQPSGGVARSVAAGPPPGFDNRVAVQVPTRRGEVLVVATQGRVYGRGDQVTIYARLLVGQGAFQDSGITPSVELRAVPGHQPVPAGASPAAAGSTLLATASPGDGGLYRVSIPTSLAPGDTLVVVVSVPGGIPSSAETQPITAQLGLTVG